MVDSNPPVTGRQMQFLGRLYEADDGMTVRETKEDLGGDAAYTSVLTIFQTLEKNGYVYHEQEGKAYRYYLAKPIEDIADDLADWMLSASTPIANGVALGILLDDRSGKVNEEMLQRAVLTGRGE